MISLIGYLTNNVRKQCLQATLILTIFLAGITYCSAQEIIDTSQLDEELTYEKRNSFTSVFYGQPGKAALYSFLIPGGGQIYNKRWWKVPIVWVGEGLLINNLKNSISELQKWETCRVGFLDPNISRECPKIQISATEERDVTDATEAFEHQQSAKAAKELAWLLLIAGHLIQTFEAFVDRHLINFNTTDQLSFIPYQDHIIESQIYTPPSTTVFSVSINLNQFTD